MELSFYKALGLNSKDRKSIQKFSKEIDIPLTRLDFYESNLIIPSGKDLKLILEYTKLTREAIMLQMGILDHSLKSIIAKNYMQLLNNEADNKESVSEKKLTTLFKTKFGELYNGDCLEFLRTIEDNKFDLIFADPPFNLKKFYLSNINDNLDFEAYINWTENWLDECVRTLKEGGSLFLWNIPKWNTHFSAFLNRRLNFRNWIAADIKYSLPIAKRLYPSHYSLLYYNKGESPNTFHPDRLPMEVCPKCYSDIKDYGGYKDKMNPLGINICDVWNDIPPVRHKKYKKREEANELSIKLLDRIIEMSSNEGDLVFDPFGGSGTTYIVSEIKKRKWMGIELGPIDTIIERFNFIEEEDRYLKKIRSNYNKLFNDKTKASRMQLNLWTDDSFRDVTVNKNSEENILERV